MDEVENVKWHLTEASLQETRADVFLIFDCCYAGDAGRPSGFGSRSFEFLAATSAGSTTKSPGPGSFTSGLIWALTQLSQERKRFTTSELTNKIKKCPGFPQRQVPMLCERNAACIERIILAPLSEDGTLTEDHKVQSPILPDTRELLLLKFVLERYPEEQEVAKLAKGVNNMVQTQDLLVRRVIWGGIHSDSHPSLDIPIVRQAIRRFRAAGEAGSRRRSIISANDESLSTSTTPSEQTLFVPSVTYTAGGMAGKGPVHMIGESRLTFKACIQDSIFHGRMAFMCLWSQVRSMGITDIPYADRRLVRLFFAITAFGVWLWWQFLVGIEDELF